MVKAWIKKAELEALFFILASAMGMWMVPMSTVLHAHGLDVLRPFAFATFAIATFVSPLVLGALSDRAVSPVKVLRWDALAAGLSAALAGTAIWLGLSPWLVWVMILVHALCYAPAWSLASTIVLERLADVQNQFGPVRAMATLGWMFGCWVVSVSGADSSPVVGYISACMWVAVAGLTLVLPAVDPKPSGAPVRWYERLGLDALTLLRNPDHRMIYLAGMLFCIPVAGFYPYTPLHLQRLGMTHTSGWMTLGQVSELFAMFLLGWLLTNIRIKWIVALGLFAGVLRFVLCSLDSTAGVLLGISLHGVSFTLVLITAQVYIDQRVEAGWRARAQSLLTLLNSGVGNLSGYLLTAWWFERCAGLGPCRWRCFWLGLAGAMAVTLTLFVLVYRGVGRGLRAASRSLAGSGDSC